MAWAKNGTPSTLSGTADVITISDLTAKIFNQFLCHIIYTGSAPGLADETFNNNTNSVYAYRRSANGASDNTFISQAKWSVFQALSDFLKILYVCSISGQEKLGIQFHILADTVGAGTAPQRTELVAKFVPSPDANITRIDWTNSSANFDFTTGTNGSALGTN